MSQYRDLNGEYKREKGDPFNPKYLTLYSQRDTLNEKTFFLYYHVDWENTGKGLANIFKHLFTDEKVGKWDRVRNGWYINSNFEEGRGWLFNNGNSSQRVPLDGWQEINNGSFVPAPHVTIRLGGLEPCKEVRVKGVKSAGTYLPTGEWSRGRPVYRQVEQPHLYMLVASGRPFWSTRTSPDSPTAWMVGSDRSGNSPGGSLVVFGWMHSGDKELRDDAATWEEMKEIGWRDDAGIDVTCLCDTHCT